MRRTPTVPTAIPHTAPRRTERSLAEPRNTFHAYAQYNAHEVELPDLLAGCHAKHAKVAERGGNGEQSTSPRSSSVMA